MSSEAIKIGGTGTMTVAQFKRIVPYLVGVRDRGKRPMAILLRARHGVGKSQIVKWIARNVLKMPLIDRRIGQMTEGDLIGLGHIDEKDMTSTFWPVKFVKEACDHPRVLFFDEPNRGTREVMQTLFQLMLDYELNGNVLHPQTVLFGAMNDGAEYQVTRMDPALKDRFWIIDLVPSREDWIEWASEPEQADGSGGGGLHPLLVDFHKEHKNHLEVEKESDARDRYPSRRSWEKLDNAARPILDYAMEHGFQDKAENKLTQQMWEDLYYLSVGFVGIPSAAAFREYVTSREAEISIDTMLNGKIEDVLRRITADKRAKWPMIQDKIIGHCKDNQLVGKQLENIGRIIAIMPGDNRLRTWMEMSSVPGADKPHVIENVKGIHPYVRQGLLGALSAGCTGEVKKQVDAAIAADDNTVAAE